ncbi:uncharacterized protein LOC110230885 [Arabidopsis lyrata subsp. lyrata]|uniref:uncharacterized protein LOC110230885 n=1 Tax=Arabidopsis lyrata subsp. lyrata TaxID=81972 RepID=UPI000A29C473|nr:uncharacterized protein LOC110230885 [Arabidopsis lyrata subsp. lyrata]|eukprot:XP_020890764.1 uncharacterized protein LOC110230885 [Arabidopsis lyrata subsp. lyrata]
MSTWNSTLCLKLVWLLFAGSGSLWVAWHHHHHIKGKSFWSLKPSASDSWNWRSLLLLRPLAEKFLTCNIRNGKNGSFWLDNWHPLGTLIKFAGQQGPGKLRIPLLSSVADAFANYSARIPRLCSPQIVAVHDLLSTVHLTDDEEDHDFYSWLGRDSNLIKFPTAETWDSLRLKAPAKAWSSSVWYKGATPKHAFNMWLAQLDRLPTRDRLIAWGMPISPACCICSQFAESRDHLFLRCVFSEQIWKLILLRLNPVSLHFLYLVFFFWVDTAQLYHCSHGFKEVGGSGCDFPYMEAGEQFFL